MTSDIQNKVSDWSECAAYLIKQQEETLRLIKTPDWAWSELEIWETTLLAHNWLLLQIYRRGRTERSNKQIYHGWPEVTFCRHGLPDILRLDNWPQISVEEFRNFCCSMGIEHRTSFPAYPQSNEAERGIQTMKKLWRNPKDKQTALLDYRTTPMKSWDLSPAMLLMGRRPQNKPPTVKELLRPVAVNHSEVRRRLEEAETPSW